MYHKLLYILLLFPLFCSAQQYEYAGKVSDNKTGEELPFVSIRFNESKQGTTSDIKGNFHIVSNEKIHTLRLSFIGYEDLIYALKPDDGKKIHLKLSPKAYELNVVKITPKENPAHPIIQKVIDNININNPEKQQSFTLTSYNNAKVEAIPDKSWDSIPNDFPTDTSIVLTKKDSSRINAKQMMLSMYFFLSESVVERKFKYPDKNFEEVIAHRTTGLKSPVISALLTQTQSFSFYNEYFTLLSEKFVNPISKGTFSRYLFELQDTIFQQEDTVFIIHFRPRLNPRFKGLEGMLYINTNQYAIQHVTAQYFDEKKDENRIIQQTDNDTAIVITDKELSDPTIVIRQHYEWIENKQWFPTQTFFELVVSTPKVAISCNVNNSFANIKLNPPIKNNEFSDVVLDIAPDASGKNEDFWLVYRDTLNDRILKTYETVDTIYDKLNLDKLVFLSKTMSEGKINYRWIDFDLMKIWDYNQYENSRYGLGLQTNDRLSRWFSVGAYGGYGFGDKEWKYGAFGEVNFDKHKDYKFKISYANDLEPSGKSGDFKRSFLTLNQYQSFLYSRFENKRNIEVGFSFPLIAYTNMEIGFDYSKKFSCFDYVFSEADFATNHYTFSDLKIKMRYAYKEKKMRLGSGIIVNTSAKNYPVIHLNYTHGFELWGGEYTYNRIEAMLSQVIDYKQWGKSKIEIMGGYVDPNLPYNRLFVPSGNKNDVGFFFENGFITMQPYEYLSNSYVTAFLSHNFGAIFGKSKYFRPELNLKANLLWGDYTGDKSLHMGIDYRIPNNGYFESGIHFDKLLVYNLLSFGGGCYYRINENYSYKTIDRFGFVWSAGFSF